MTIISEADFRLPDLKRRATDEGGEAFAAAMSELVSTAQIDVRGPRHEVPYREFREELRRVDAAAEVLAAELRSLTDFGRATLRVYDPKLMDRMGTALHILRRTTAQAAQDLPRSKQPDLIREEIITKLRDLFAAHRVPFTATATRAESRKPGPQRMSTSLAVESVSLALDISTEAAQKAIRDHAKRR